MERERWLEMQAVKHWWQALADPESEALSRGADEAAMRNHGFELPEHLFLGLTDPASRANFLLEYLDLDVAALRSAVEGELGPRVPENPRLAAEALRQQKLEA